MLTKIESSKGAKLRLLAFLPVLLSVLLVFACQQTEDQILEDNRKSEVSEVSESKDGNTYFVVEEMPMFPGGDLELRKFIAANVVYPENAKQNGIQGRVFVQFVVSADGSIEEVKVVRGVAPSLDKEAIRVISSMEGWEPGLQRGKPVRVSFTVPINFQLN